MTHKIQEDLSSLVKESARFQESLDLALILYPDDIKQIIFELFLKDFLSQKFKTIEQISEDDLVLATKYARVTIDEIFVKNLPI